MGIDIVTVICTELEEAIGEVEADEELVRREVDTVARSIGAISCVVVRPDGSLAGTNNDCYGFIQSIREEQPGWRADAGPGLVVGAGGGARAVCYALAEAGARVVAVPEVTQYDVANVETSLFDVKTKRVVWAGTTQTFNPTTVAQETPGFAKLIIGQLAARGLIAAPKST